MLILSINTAFAALEGAVLKGETCLAEARSEMKRGQDAALPGFVDDLLEAAGAALSDMDRLAVVTGPGSFTGIRIGVAYMRGLALVLKTPCVGITSLEAAVSGNADRPVLCALQAQKRPPDQTWWVQELIAGYGENTPVELNRDDVLVRLKSHAGAVYASGQDALLPDMSGKQIKALVPSARIAGLKALSAAPEAHLPSPVYARAPDAALPAARTAKATGDLIVLRPDDAGVLATLHAAGFAEGWPASAFRSLLREPGILGLGVERAGTLVGFAVVRIVAGEADLLTIVTDPSKRRSGIARHLMLALKSRLGERGISRWTLDVAEDNQAAIKLYQTAGFAEDGRRKGYYTTGREKPVDAVLMSRPMGL